MTSRAAQNVARKQIIDEIIDSLETDGQYAIYSGSLGRDSDYETMLSYLKRINAD